MPRRAFRKIRDTLAPRAPADAPRVVVAPEQGVLIAADEVAVRPIGALPRPGMIQKIYDPFHALPPFMMASLEGAAGGDAVPHWADGSTGGLRFGVHLSRVADVHYAPGYGAVIDPDGRAFLSTVSEATFLSPTLTALPGVLPSGGEAVFAPPADLPHFPAASVFMPWGALSNYGHFLLDALPGLVLFADHGLLSRWPALAPPLSGWQREFLALALRPGETVSEIEPPLIRVDDLLFTSCMDHFLHAPNLPLDRVRARILEAAPAPAEPGPRRLYLTRRGQGKRVLVNEAELEAALQARGFTVIAPETLSVLEQVQLFRDAEVVVSPTGAALANALFMAPGAQVFELQPSNFMGIWVRAVCQFVDVDWRGWFRRSPIEETQVRIGGALQPGLSFTWDLALPPFLQFLDARL